MIDAFAQTPKSAKQPTTVKNFFIYSASIRSCVKAVKKYSIALTALRTVAYELYTRGSPRTDPNVFHKVLVLHAKICQLKAKRTGFRRSVQVYLVLDGTTSC